MPTHKGDIAFFGGHIESNESALEAARREFSEESALSANDLKLRTQIPLLVHRGRSIKAFVFDYQRSTDYFLKNICSNSEWETGFFIETSVFTDKERWSFGLSLSGDHQDRILFCDLGQKGKNLWGISALFIRYLVDQDLF